MNAETIILKIKRGDLQTCRFIYELFYKPVYQSAYCIINDPGLAEDIAHEVFIKMNHKIEQLKDPTKLEAWLCRMAMNTARDIIRHRSRNTYYLETGDIYPNNQQLSPETNLLIEEDKKMVIKKINCLSSGYRQVLYLKYYREMTCEEISAILNLPIGTVKSRLFHARHKIKKLIETETKNTALM